MFNSNLLHSLELQHCMPSCFIRSSNLALSRALVKTSSTWFSN
uniref:Uncharacterized protein n=1 Tax=Rhizophora mucronata TaxID=61149 RepID=A0A2P2QGZ6_RHIMU